MYKYESKLNHFCNWLYRDTFKQYDMKQFVLLFFLFLIGGVWSQDITFVIEGRMTDNDTGAKLGGVTVSLEKDGKVLGTTQTASNGRYKLTATGPIGDGYRIVFSKPGMVSKKMTFDGSDINIEDLPPGNEVYIPDVSGSLFAERPGVDFSFLQNDADAVVKWKWDKTVGLTFDRNDAERVKHKVEQLLIKAEKEAAELEQKYQAAILSGDMYFEQKEYEKAVEKYEEALGYKPKEEYPIEKLDELDALIQAQKEEALAQQQADAKYNDLIKEADGLRDSDKLEEAIVKYEEAIAEKNEQYPKDQIANLKLLIEKRNKEAENQAKYEAAIKEADGLFGSDKLEQAKVKYEEASGYKSSEQYPKDKIKEITKMLDERANEAEINAKYQEAITQADGLFSSEQYEKAKAKYEEAAGLKSQEQYPKDRIVECEKRIADQKASAEKDEQIKELISKGDAAMNKSDYQSAVDNYKEVLNIEAGHPEATEKLALAEKKLKEKEGEEELAAKFDELVSQGDDQVSKEDFASAVDSYTEALTIKSSPAVEAKLKEARKKMDEFSAEKEKRDQYEKLMSEGAQAMSASSWIDAKSKYQQASNLYPSEQEPKDKLKEIEDKLANAEAQAEIDQKYKEKMEEGDRLMTDQNYLEAIKAYNEALALKPDEKEPVNKAAEAQRLAEAANSEADRLYEKILSTAEQKLEDGDYARATELAKRAKENRPQDDRPDELLTRIEEYKQRDKKYTSLLAEADDLAQAKKYAAAKAKYEEAKATKPDESLPPQKIEEMDKLISESASEAEREALYNQYMTEGGSKESSRDFEEALSAYKNALNVKPGDTKAQNKVDEIQQILDDLANAAASEKDLKEKFDNYVKEADGYFENERYLDAKEAYEKALALIPTDKYALDRRDESIRLEKEKSLREEEEQYQNLIKAADDNFDQENYEKAKDYYTRAMNVRSSDPYPKERLEEIEAKLNPVVQKSDDLDDLGTPFSGSILDGEVLLRKAEQQRVRNKTEGVVSTVDGISDREAAMTDEKEQDHLTTTNEIYKITDKIIARNVDDNEKRIDNAITIDKSMVDLEVEANADMEYEHQEALGNQDVLTTIDKEVALDYNEKESVYMDNTDIVEGYNIAQEQDLSQRTTAEKGTNVFADQQLTVVNSKVRTEMIDDYKEREKASRVSEGIEREANRELNMAQKREEAEVQEVNVVVEGIERNIEEKYVEGHVIANENNEELKSIANELIENEEGRVEEDVALNYGADKTIQNIEKNVEDRFDEGEKVATDNNDEFKVIDNGLVEKGDYMNKVEDNSLKKKDLEVQAKMEKANKAQEGISKNREHNAQVLDESTIQFDEDLRAEYNSETEKYYSNVDEIQKSIDVNNEIGEVADAAMEKKIEYSERMEEKTLNTSEAYEDSDHQGRTDALETINQIDIDYSANEASEAQRTKDNVPLIENIEKGAMDEMTKIGANEKDEHYKAKGEIDKITDEPREKTVVVNSLGKEYPEGVSQEVFTKQDQNGLMTELITRRIVVVDGHADVYIRTQTTHGITYTKNGQPSLEYVWQKETQNPHLERHF